MWIYSTLGFYSIVAHEETENLWLVRARAQSDANRLTEAVAARDVITTSPLKFEHTPDHDYAYRAMVNRHGLCVVIDTLQETITYPNFKAAVVAMGSARVFYWTLLGNLWTKTMESFGTGIYVKGKTDEKEKTQED